MKKRYFLLIFLFSVITSYLYFVNHPHKGFFSRYNYKVGQIADRDIIAPFQFDVLKNEEELAQDRAELAETIEKVYRISEQRQLNTISNLYHILEIFAMTNSDDIHEVVSKLADLGYELSENAIIQLFNPVVRAKLSDYLTKNIIEVMRIGIYPQNYDRPNILVKRNSEINRYTLQRLYSLNEAKKFLVEEAPDRELRIIVEDIVRYILVENIVVDENYMETLIDEEFSKKVNPVLTSVLEKEEIIRKNRKITELDLRKLKALSEIQEQMSFEPKLTQIFISSLGILLLSTIFFVSFILISNLFLKNVIKTTTHYIIILCSFLITTLFTVIINLLPYHNSLLIPFSFISISLALIFNPLVSLIAISFNYLIMVPFLNWEIVNPMIIYTSNIIFLVFISYMKDKHKNFPLLLYLLISYLLTNIIVAMILFEQIGVFIDRIIYSAISCFLSIGGIILILPIIEKKLNLATKMILLELLDTNNPLLKRMALETPGTYHHSLTVGFLVESAAEAIGANALLARVGSYYHDIGKLENPEYFIENNTESTVLHESKTYQESAEIIKRHVPAGIALAKKNKLPRQVIEIIKQHHGDSKVGYFYLKALKEGQNADKNIFSYPGPKPQTKEAALVMIGDIIESTAKSKNLKDADDSVLKNIIDDTINNLIKEKQLDETPLTLKEIDLVKNVMFSVLTGIFRKRIDYS